MKLASPTVVPASTVPCRWIVLVRARIASSSVVLPAWNGPTSAMHLGPRALPLPAIAIPPARNRDCVSIVSGKRGDWQEAAAIGRGRAGSVESKKPPGRAAGWLELRHSGKSSVSADPAQVEPGDAGRQVEADLTLHRERLQRDRPVRSADQRIGAETGEHRGFRRRARIGAGQRADRAVGGGENEPHHHAARGHADVETELGDRAGVVLDRTGDRRRERAAHVALRPDDQADAGRHVAGQRSGLYALLRLGGAGQRREHQCGSRDEGAEHGNPPWFTERLEPSVAVAEPPTAILFRTRPPV